MSKEKQKKTDFLTHSNKQKIKINENNQKIN